MLKFRKILLLIGDILLLYLSLAIALFIGFWKSFNWEIFLKHLSPFSFLYFFWLIIFYIFGLYELNLIRTNFTLYPRILGALLTAILAGIIFFYLIPWLGITPKTNLVLNALIFGILISSWRKLFYSLFSAHFLNKVAILGKNLESQKLSKEIVSRPYLGYKLTTIDSNQDLFSQIQSKKIDTLVVGEDLNSNPELIKDLYQCLPARINFLDLSRAYEIICEKIPISNISQAWFLENLREREKGFYDKVKKIMDIVLASIILLLTLPLWPFIIFAIKLEDRGSIFYSQKRIGKNKKPFLLTKFRSMRVGAEKETGAVWAEKEDPRITKVGKILRRTHLDEIPQMINVLKGDISLVGPRPERPEFVEKLEKEIPHYHLRHLIKPGFTGWAQIKFRYGRSVM
ncbi:MAG: sugar transferase, partial [Patescibacteria group bacterium]|nr:sugar transferase [Patescibacteria group bacterium]